MVNFLIVLSVLVLFHELGHYLAARYFDVKVESFSIGLGPRLLGYKRNGTDFKICLLPLGGYVKMAGQSVIGEPTGEPGELLSKPRWQRLIIVGMGPLFNFILAIALLAGLYTYRYERAQLLRLRQGGVDPLMAQQHLRQVPQRGQPMLGHATQFSVRYSMTHSKYSGSS